MNDYNDSSLMNSELAVEIMSHISSHGNKDYGSNIAEELGRSQSSICRVITSMAEKGFLRRWKREKVRYYSVDYEEIASFWIEQMKEEMKEISGDSSNWVKKIKENEEFLQQLGEEFFQNVLESEDLDECTLDDLLFKRFAGTIAFKLQQDEEFLQEKRYLFPPTMASSFHFHYCGYPDQLDESIEEIE